MVTRRRAPPETIVDIPPLPPPLPRPSFHSISTPQPTPAFAFGPAFAFASFFAIALINHSIQPLSLHARPSTLFTSFYSLSLSISLSILSFPSSLVTSHTTTAITSCAYSSTRRAHPTDKTFPSFPSTIAAPSLKAYLTPLVALTHRLRRIYPPVGYPRTK
ncbi:hypothetical protein LX36DRAFT_338833 [Colletotrichum falcatum]|nr:hypothetical protein LX36DRAFT_338833 [Colletotrichum falcatum]